MKKMCRVFIKVVKWYLVVDVIEWAFVGSKELWRKDIDKMPTGKAMCRLLREAFYTWKYGKYVSFTKGES